MMVASVIAYVPPLLERMRAGTVVVLKPMVLAALGPLALAPEPSG